MAHLRGKTILVGVSGGIAAYKGAELVRLFRKAGAEVRVVLTRAAAAFVTPLTFEALSGAPVGTDILASGQDRAINHIELADKADIVVVAPATADLIARYAAGMADDLLTAVLLATRAPVLLAPAMNVNMWTHPLTQRNLHALTHTGRVHIVGPDAGELACGWVGAGRLMETPEIVDAADRVLGPRDLVGKRVLVTAGPTHEPVDDVRFLGNRSSGRMGFELAREAARRGAEVVLVAGPVGLATPGGVERLDVETASDMRTVLAREVPKVDVVVMVAAVADFRPAERAAGKLHRGSPQLKTLPLAANPDLLAELGRARRGRKPVLVGFAAEVDATGPALVERARAKLAAKRCDVVVANDVGDPEIGFGSDENAVTLVFADGRIADLPRAPKDELSAALWPHLVELMAVVDEAPPPRRRAAGRAGKPKGRGRG